MNETVGTRIRKARKLLGLSGEAFGSRIGLSKGALSNIERGTNGASERTLKLICSTYSIDYFWLTEGKGEMLVDNTEALIDGIARERNCSTEETELLKKLFSLPQKQFDLVMGIIENFKEENEKDE